MPAVADVSHFNAFTREISRLSGTQLWVVILGEVAKVLEACVRLTTRANFEKIQRSVEFKNRTLRTGGKGSGPATIYITKNGVAWFADEPGDGYEGIAKGRTSHGKTFHPMTEFLHYSDERWARYQQFLAELKSKYINVREVLGRAGQSWVQVAQSLGISLQGIPAYVRNAPPFKGVHHMNGASRRSVTAQGVFLEIKNFAPILLGTIDGNRILQTAINGRLKFFNENVRRGVFEDVANRARAYPSFFVK